MPRKLYLVNISEHHPYGDKDPILFLSFFFILYLVHFFNTIMFLTEVYD